jgi:hypothetical protein
MWKYREQRRKNANDFTVYIEQTMGMAAVKILDCVN